MRFVLLTLTVCSLLAGQVHADVVGPPRENCIDGTTGETCHGGPYCRVRACQDDAGCEGGKVCREVAFCATKVYCVGMLPPDEDPEDYVVDGIQSLCAADGSCEAGECKNLKACVEPAVEPFVEAVAEALVELAEDTGTPPVAEPVVDAGPPSDSEPSGCATGVGAGAAGLLVVLLLLGWLYARRR